MVGANYQHNGEGAIYIFARTGSVWRQQAEFSYPGSVLYAEFGWAVALVGLWVDAFSHTVLACRPLGVTHWPCSRDGTRRRHGPEVASGEAVT